MSNLTQFLERLHGRGVQLWSDGDQLRFRGPEGSVTPEILAELKTRKAKILGVLRAGNAQPSGSNVAIPKVDRDQDLPLSFAQERLWFVDRLEGGSTHYNMPMALRFEGRLDVDRLTRSLNRVIARHEVLRTNFREVDGRAVQVIHPEREFHFQREDLRHLGAEARQDAVRQLTGRMAAEPFDLSRDLLLRGVVCQLAEDSYALVMTVHHIVCDGWSLNILIGEMARFYQSQPEGAENDGAQSGHFTWSPPELPIQYADYANWQRAQCTAEVLDEQLAYWKKQLADAPHVLQLPTDRQRPPVQTYRGATEHFQIDAATTEKLAALARQSEASMYMTLVSAYCALLARYSGQDDLLVGSVFANRQHIDTEGLVGFFVNMLILRGDLRGNPSFRELLSRVRKTAVEGFANQDLPLEKLVAHLSPDRDLSRTPMVQAAFTFGKFSPSSADLPGISIRPLPVESGTAKTDLAFLVDEAAEGLSGAAEYSTDLFDRSTIQRMTSDYQELLRVIAEDPDRTLSEIYSTAGLRQPAADSGDLFKKLRERTNLTENQLQMWLGHNFDPAKPIYNNGGYFEIGAGFSPDLFLAAMRTLVNSADALRTVYEEVDGVPQRKILPALAEGANYLDFSAHVDPGVAARQWCQRRFETPFDLRQLPYEFVILKVSAAEFLWYYNTHQIAADAFSATCIVEALSELYPRAADGTLPETIDLPQFEQFVTADREYRDSSRYLKAKAHWEEKLAVDWSPIAFFGKPPVAESTRIEKRSFDLGAERTAKLRQLGLQLGSQSTLDATVFNLLLALLAASFHRLGGGARQISFGIPLHNRRLKALKKGIGSFMQVTPLRFPLSGDDDLAALVSSIASALLENMRYGQYVVRAPKQNSLYDVTVNYHAESFPALAGMPLNSIYLHPGDGYESLGIQIRDFNAAGSLIVDFDFRCAVFDDQQRELTMQSFLRVIDAFLAQPELRLAEIDLLTPEESALIVTGFNPPHGSLPTPPTVLERFAAQVRRVPAKQAVCFAQQSLTYAQLDERAESLAAHLAAQGVSTECRVGVCLDRSLDLIVALLGILKAGAAYVPLDPSYPTERLDFMLRDSRASVVVTQSGHAADLDREGLHIVCLDTADLTAGEAKAGFEAARVEPASAAYVIYTSGTTGVPKGVVVTHQALANFTAAAVSEYKIQASDRVLQFASISFDAAAEEIYPCLVSGGTLVVRTPEMTASLEQLLADTIRWELTVMDLPTAYWHQLTAEMVAAGIELPESLRLVIIGGEKAIAARVADWRRHVGDRPMLVNSYGPTETTVVATTYSCQQVAPESDTEIPIGKPLPGVQVYLLDQKLRPVPVGLPGQIYVGGGNLARGYLNRPGLTAAKFIPNPFSDRPGERLYQTGDVGRYLPDGNIEFLGRVDEQVKIRGFRIELGEVEAALAAHPQVREAAVVALPDATGDQRLVAYLSSQPALATAEVRSFLQAKLPGYMVPAALVHLDRLPRNAQGKVDRQALPAPSSVVNRDVPYVDPTTPHELLLAKIWKDVLGLAEVGVDHNFFELGGDSIRSIQIIARANREGLSLTPKQLFQHQTIAELAAILDASAAPHDRAEEIPDSVPLVPWQRQFLARQRPPAEASAWVLLECLDPALTVADLQAAMQAVVLQHDALRLRFDRGHERASLADPAADPITLETIDLSHLAPAELTAALQAERECLQTELDPSAGPVVRARLLTWETNRALCWAVHCLVADRVSWQRLLEDLQTCCRQRLDGQPISLNPNTVAWHTWVERGGAKQPGLQALDRQADIRSAVSPPAVGGKDAAAELQTHSVRLDAALTKALQLDVGQFHHASLNEILLAGLVRAIRRWTGAAQILVRHTGNMREGQAIDGRSASTPATSQTALFQAAVSRTVGPLAAPYSLPLAAAETDSALESFKAIKEQVRGNLLQQASSSPSARHATWVGDHASGNVQPAPPCVFFDYLGDLDQLPSPPRLFGVMDQRLPTAGAADRPHDGLAVTAEVRDGRLQLDLSVPAERFAHAEISSLANWYRQELTSLLDECRAAQSAGCTPSDFPLATIDQPDLDRLLAGKRDIESLYPLSPLQKGMLFHSLSAPGSGVYVGQVSGEFGDDICEADFRRAWQAAVDRHAVLRTSLHWEGLAHPLQCVQGKADLTFECHDWRDAAEDSLAGRLEAFLAADIQRGFDLTAAPLVRISWITLPGGRSHFALTMHHIIYDGWSISALLAEVWHTYAALRAGETPAFARAPSYETYIAWLQGQDPRESEAFWRSYLGGFSAPTRLPASASAALPSDHLQESFQMPPDVTRKLKEFAREHRLTVNTLVDGAWALLLSHVTRSDDIVVGVTVSGRPPALAGVEEILGLFMNTLPLRVRIPIDRPLVEWLREVQESENDLRQHEWSSLVDIQRWSNVPVGQPLFESHLVFENFPREEELLAGSTLPVRQLRTSHRATSPLTVAIFPGELLAGTLTYDVARFDPRAIAGFSRSFQTILQFFADSPEASTADLRDALEEDERQRRQTWLRERKASNARRLRAVSQGDERVQP